MFIHVHSHSSSKRGSEVAQVCVQDTIQAVSIVDLYVAPPAVAIDHQGELHDTTGVSIRRHLVEDIGLLGAMAIDQLPRFTFDKDAMQTQRSTTTNRAYNIYIC